MRIRVLSTGLFLIDLETRIPFRYGIVTMTHLPHIFLRVEVVFDEGRCYGIAADDLPPKWFTKDPESLFREDVEDMLEVIEAACIHVRAIGEAESVFALWRQLWKEQLRWGEGRKFPALLWGFGVSLVERAVVDAFCRSTETPFSNAVRLNTLGIDLAVVHPELVGSRPKELLPGEPLGSTIARHTVGLADPLTVDEIEPEERVDDGLPQALYSVP